ncbi:hypothetical protein AL073_16380 [Loktanella sp. 1ANDIMAR09]|nr:hypothetical protein AL073_16380 [Loktanella sp. 1ANDIMAR09]
MSWLGSVLSFQAFANGFWVFVGIMAGVIIQQVVNHAEKRKQAKSALQVMQTEIAYNKGEVAKLLERVAWLKQRIASSQIEEADLFLPMHTFDYSAVGPLTNSGYFHVLLGPKRVGNYLEFYHFFKNENGANLTGMLKAEHAAGKSMAFLEWFERQCEELVGKIEPIEESRMDRLKLQLVEYKRKS